MTRMRHSKRSLPDAEKEAFETNYMYGGDHSGGKDLRDRIHGDGTWDRVFLENPFLFLSLSS